MKIKVFRFLLRFTAVNVVLYFIAAFVLIHWPLPEMKSTENYDFSGIVKSASDEKFATSKSIQLRDGKKLFVRYYDGNVKNILIFLHGSGSDSRYLSKASKFFADNNMFSVITPDLRGHGHSSFDKKGDIDYMGQLEHDIEDVVLYAKNVLKANQVILAGHSSGGGLALRYLSNEQTTSVDGGILFSPYLGYKSPTLKPGNGNWVTVSVKRWVGLSMLSNIGITSFNNKSVLFFNRAKKWNDSLQVSDYSYNMAMSMDPIDYKKDIKGIKVPTIILVGQNDESFYANAFEKVFSKSEYTSTYIIENTAHLNVVDNSLTLDKISNWMHGLKK